MIATELPCRCPRCHFHESEQGHRSILADGSATGCPDSGPLGLILARERRDAGMAATEAAHPDDVARVDAVLAEFVSARRPFSANDTRPRLQGVKGSVIGSRWGAASRSGRMVRTGERVPSTDPGTHGHLIDIWIGVPA